MKKEKIYKLNLIKIKNFCCTKKKKTTVNRMKSQVTDWEKIYEKDIW